MPQQSPSWSSKLCSLVSWLLFITISCCILLHLLHLSTVDVPNQSKFVYMHKVFMKNPYAKVITHLQQHRYSIVKTNSHDFVERAIEFVAANRTLPIVTRNYNKIHKSVYPLYRFLQTINSHIQHLLGEDGKKIYILYINKHVPENNIELIQKYYPYSYIYVVVEPKNKLKIKGFEVVKGIYHINLNDQGTVTELLTFANYPLEVAKVYTNYFNASIDRIFTYLSKNSEDIENFLGEFNIPVNVSRNAYKILEYFCKKGSLNKKNKKHSQNPYIYEYLYYVGVIVDDGLYWENDLFRLNYMYKAGLNCVQMIAPETLFDLGLYNSKYRVQRNSDKIVESENENKQNCKCVCTDNEYNNSEVYTNTNTYDSASLNNYSNIVSSEDEQYNYTVLNEEYELKNTTTDSISETTTQENDEIIAENQDNQYNEGNEEENEHHEGSYNTHDEQYNQQNDDDGYASPYQEHKNENEYL